MTRLWGKQKVNRKSDKDVMTGKWEADLTYMHRCKIGRQEICKLNSTAHKNGNKPRPIMAYLGFK